MGNRVKTKRWVIDRTTGTIKRRGLGLGSRTVDARLFRVLDLLIDRADEPVSHDDIIKDAWAGRLVSADSVSTAIYQLRKILGEDARNPQNLFTVPHKGYMWRGGVTASAGSDRRGGFLPAWSYAVLAGFCLAILILSPLDQHREDSVQPASEYIFLAPTVNATGDRELDLPSDAVNATFINALLRLNPDLAATRIEQVDSRLHLQSEVVYFDNRPTLVLTLIDSQQELKLWSEYYDFHNNVDGPSLVEHAARRATQAMSRI